MVAMSTRTNALDSFGTRSPSKVNPRKALEAAGALFGLKKVTQAEWSGKPANPDLHVVVRTDTGEAIGQVGNAYECFDNEAFFVPTVEELVTTGARIDRCQLLDRGTRSFMRLSWDEDHDLTIGRPKVGDIVGRRAILSTSHDGKSAGKFSLQMLRLICSNGMTVPIGTFETALTHTVGGHQQLIDLQKLMPMIERYVRQFGAAANLLADTHIDMSREKVRKNTWAIAAKMVDSAGKAGNKKDGKPNRAKDRVRRIMELFQGGQPGADSRECNGTGWGLYNAGVDYFTHDKGTRGDNERVQRFKSLLPSGSANKEIVRAWDVVVDGLGVKDEMEAIAAIN